MASKSESIRLRAEVRRPERTGRGAWRPLAAFREWSSSMQIGPSRSAQVGRHTGARI